MISEVEVTEYLFPVINRDTFDWLPIKLRVLYPVARNLLLADAITLLAANRFTFQLLLELTEILALELEKILTPLLPLIYTFEYAVRLRLFARVSKLLILKLIYGADRVILDVADNNALPFEPSKYIEQLDVLMLKLSVS